ncbi:MAG: hypothetical protein ACHBNF_08710 [Chromatiales bacterium]
MNGLPDPKKSKPHPIEVARELTDLSEEDLARLLEPAQLTQGGIRK